MYAPHITISISAYIDTHYNYVCANKKAHNAAVLRHVTYPVITTSCHKVINSLLIPCTKQYFMTNSSGSASVRVTSNG